MLSKKGWSSVYRDITRASRLLRLREGPGGDFVVNNVGKFGSIDVWVGDLGDMEALAGLLESRYGWRAVDASSDWILYSEYGERPALVIGEYGD